MTEPVPHLSDAQIQRLLADLSQQSGSLTPDDLHRLQDLVQRVGGIEAAQSLFETLEDIEADGEGLEEMDAEGLDFDDLDDADDDDLDQLAA